MVAIESTFPDRVFLSKGSECCVCLDAFGAAAEDAAAVKESAQHVARLLRELDPSVTALRCAIPCCCSAAFLCESSLAGAVMRFTERALFRYVRGACAH
jgi:hypothetical protein